MSDIARAARITLIIETMSMWIVYLWASGDSMKGEGWTFERSQVKVGRSKVLMNDGVIIKSVIKLKTGNLMTILLIVSKQKICCYQPDNNGKNLCVSLAKMLL